MLNRYTLTAITLALAAVAAQPSLAQTTSGMPTKSGSLAPAGEGPGAEASAAVRHGRSTKSRAMVKAQTKSAETSGALQPAGEAPLPSGSMLKEGGPMATPSSTKSRAVVKAQTKAAEKNGTLQPAGEATQPVAQTPKK